MLATVCTLCELRRLGALETILTCATTQLRMRGEKTQAPDAPGIPMVKSLVHRSASLAAKAREEAVKFAQELLQCLGERSSEDCDEALRAEVVNISGRYQDLEERLRACLVSLQALEDASAPVAVQLSPRPDDDSAEEME